MNALAISLIIRALLDQCIADGAAWCLLLPDRHNVTLRDHAPSLRGSMQVDGSPLRETMASL